MVFQRVAFVHISLKGFGDILDPKNSVGFDMRSKMLLLYFFGGKGESKLKKIKLRNIRRGESCLICSV